MRNAADDGIVIEPEDRNEAYQSVVSDLVSLIGHVRASLTLIESAISREISAGSQEPSSNVIVLDDVTPPYMSATAALRACDANLVITLRSMLDSKGSTRGVSDYFERAPALSIGGG